MVRNILPANISIIKEPNKLIYDRLVELDKKTLSRWHHVRIIMGITICRYITESGEHIVIIEWLTVEKTSNSATTNCLN